MTWNRRYALISYVRSTLWIAPLIALVLEQATFRILYVYEIDIGFVPGFRFGGAATSAAMDYVITTMISFIVFTFGSLLVAIQVASGQLSPRIIATTLLRDNVIRCTVGLFIYALLLAVAIKTRVETSPDFLASLAAILGITSIVAFLFLIDYAARLLRPVSIVWRIAQQGIKVIEDVYPRPTLDLEIAPRPREKLGPADRTIMHRGTSAIVIATNLKAMIAAAKRANGVIEVLPRVGDFVAEGEPLFLLYGRASVIDKRILCGQVAFGRERTIEQDSTFAIRVIVDIAIKALSKAINDPTTAILALDQLHRLLRIIGKRQLHDERIFDETGQLRVILPMPNWDNFVQLALSEIRQYGAENFQVARRMRAMIEDLIQSLPERRHAALLRELDLLDNTLAKVFLIPEDLALARIPDSQGLGGSS